MKRSRRYLTAAVLAVVVLAGISVANAAGLSLTAGAVTARSMTHPCPGTASMVPANRQSGTTYRSVVLALPAGCAGLPVQLYLDHPSNSSDDESGSGTTDASGVVSIRMTGNYNRAVAFTPRATVSGWDLPVAWNTTLMPPIWCTVTDGSGATCTATVTIFTGVKPPGTTTATYYDVVATTTSTAWVPWEVGFNLAHPFYGSAPTRLGNSDNDGYDDGDLEWGTGGDYNDIVRENACGTSPLTVAGIDSGDSGDRFYNILNNRVRQFSLVVNRTEAGYSDVLSPNCR